MQQEVEEKEGEEQEKNKQIDYKEEKVGYGEITREREDGGGA